MRVISGLDAAGFGLASDGFFEVLLLIERQLRIRIYVFALEPCCHLGSRLSRNAATPSRALVEFRADKWCSNVSSSSWLNDEGQRSSSTFLVWAIDSGPPCNAVRASDIASSIKRSTGVMRLTNPICRARSEEINSPNKSNSRASRS